MPRGVYQRTEYHRKINSEAHKGIRAGMLGKKHSEEAKRKISENNPSKRPEVRRKISKAHKGKKLSEETKRKIGEALKGKKRPDVGIKISKAKTGKKLPRMSESKMGIKNPMYGKKGKLHPNWLNGISFEPYGLEFNEDLKEVIRNRDRRKCFLCEKTELENSRKLMVHHIDYCKQNNNPNNLITLCHSCHSKTNYRRDYWRNYFNEIIKRNFSKGYDSELEN